ncbi:hypothetical protein CK228_04520 [Mesorhizobium sp. WSM4312]|uniref:hypothetical protein n=1 Tax=Mesorhizobium sp. WSM4312 TaxID=2029411 RepID=UPI000BB01230|nr:hypothetical protein [Mesorhizobium sp. WSM4312]PBB69886.1 hypothetical protein CK228_04520 [Mesorhizobium sp. WSM4312]
MEDPQPADRASKIINNTKVIFEILGIIAAGVWAFFVFGKTQDPQFHSQLNVSSKINFFRSVSESGSCVTAINVTISNDRNASVKVKSLSLRVWHFDFPSSQSGGGYFDYEALKQTKPTWELPKGAGSVLMGQYYPKTDYGYQFQFIGDRKERYVYYIAQIETDPVEVGMETFSSSETENNCNRV